MLQIREILEERSIPFEVRPLKAQTGAFGENTLVRLSADDASNSQKAVLVIAVPVEDNRLGMESAIDLIVELSESAQGTPLHVFFLDDETSRIPLRYGMPRHFGLRALIAEYPVPEERSVLYFAPGNRAEDLTVQHASSGTLSPLATLKPLMAALDKNRISWALETPWNELFRLRLVDGPEALQLLNTAGYHAIAITSPSKSTPLLAARENDTLSAESLAQALADYTLAHPHSLEAPDKRYTLFQLGQRVWPIDEQFVIIAFLLVTVLSSVYILVYSMTKRSILVARMRVFLRRVWILGVLALVLFICLFAAEYFVSTAYRRITGSAQALGSMHMAAKGLLTIITAIAFYMLLNLLILYRRLPVRSHFWAVATIVFFALATLVTASIDFTFVPVFLWAYVLSFVSAQFSRMLPSLLLAIAAMFPVANTAIGAAMTKGSRLLELFTTGSPLASLYMVIVLLPFMLLVKKSLPTRSRRLGFSTIAIRLPMRITFCAVSIAASYFAFSTLPATPHESNASIRRVSPQVRVGAGVDEDSTISLVRREFLDRQTISISIPTTDKPDRVEIEIIGDSALFVYDSQVPWLADASGTHITFTTGENPPDPLSFDVTLQRNAKGIIRARKLSYDDNTETMSERLELKRLESK